MTAQALLAFVVRLLALAVMAALVLVVTWAFIVGHDPNPDDFLDYIDLRFPYPPADWSSEVLAIGSGIGAFLIGYIFFEREGNGTGPKVLGVSIFGIVFILGALILVAASYFTSHVLITGEKVILCTDDAVTNCFPRISPDGFAFLRDATTTAYKLLAAILGVALSAVKATAKGTSTHSDAGAKPAAVVAGRDG